jgi:EAL domain-containing protein (putative c-di-GMP-specific phosphodiesterase class I)
VADHLAQRPDERLVLPIAGSTLRDPDWLGTLAAHLGARPGVQSRLIVEVPEEALAEPEAAGRLNALKALGVGTMLGGFGGGIVSARMLRGLALDVLKIDARFVQALPRSTADRLVLRTLIDLAQHVGLTSLADGVADEAAARLLAGWGVDYLQGPFLGDPTRLRGRDQAPARRSRAG